MSIEFDYHRVIHPEYWGDGFVAGSLPPDPNPLELDGRTKVMNVPSRVRVAVFDRRRMYCVASTLSAEDGTWIVRDLDRSRQFLILGYDGRTSVNAAVQDGVTPAEMV